MKKMHNAYKDNDKNKKYKNSKDTPHEDDNKGKK